MGQPARTLERSDAGNRRRVKAHRARAKEAEVLQAAIIPPAPDGFTEEMAKDWGQTIQALADNNLLVPARVALLEQYCMLRARIKIDGVEGLSSGMHAQLKAVTLEMWKPAQALQAKEENTFGNL